MPQYNSNSGENKMTAKNKEPKVEPQVEDTKKIFTLDMIDNVPEPKRHKVYIPELGKGKFVYMWEPTSQLIETAQKFALTKGEVDEDKFYISLAIECIRDSDSPNGKKIFSYSNEALFTKKLPATFLERIKYEFMQFSMERITDNVDTLVIVDEEAPEVEPEEEIVEELFNLDMLDDIPQIERKKLITPELGKDTYVWIWEPTPDEYAKIVKNSLRKNGTHDNVRYRLSLAIFCIRDSDSNDAKKIFNYDHMDFLKSLPSSFLATVEFEVGRLSLLREEAVKAKEDFFIQAPLDSN